MLPTKFSIVGNSPHLRFKVFSKISSCLGRLSVVCMNDMTRHLSKTVVQSSTSGAGDACKRRWRLCDGVQQSSGCHFTNKTRHRMTLYHAQNLTSLRRRVNQNKPECSFSYKPTYYGINIIGEIYNTFENSFDSVDLVEYRIRIRFWFWNLIFRNQRVCFLTSDSLWYQHNRGNL